jgi:hypothetical protein
MAFVSTAVFARALAGAVLALTLAMPALAADPVTTPAPEPVLGGELTPFGAIRAANRNDTIPIWTGGMTELPPGYAAGKHMRDPFLDDSRWFTVKAADLDRYKSRLSAGLIALLQKYPASFEIPMYQTRRTFAAPQRIYDASIENAGRAKLSENGLAVSGAKVGIPFPVPKTGEQAMWNHLLRWQGESVTRTAAIAVPDERGTSSPALYREDRLSAYATGQDGPVASYQRRTGLRPAEVAGSTLLTQQTFNPLQRPPATWYRPAGDKALPVRAPDFAYDTPDPATGGLRTADMADMFSGLLDRFDFVLLGRREMYVPYNAWRLTTPDLTVEEVFWSAHPNPTLLRYELHRVWVVEATLKRGLRHAFPRRVYYLDEDSWQILMADHYGPDGALARYAEAHPIMHPQVPVMLPAREVAYDLASGRYVASGLDGTEKPPVFDKPLKPEDFAPEALMPKRR